MKSILRALTLTFALGSTFASPAFAEKPIEKSMSAKEKDIRKLLEVTGSGEVGILVMNEMLSNMKKALPQVPDKFWEEIAKEAHPEQIVDIAVPIYDRRFSHAEIQAILAFYATPAGKRLIAELPGITQESMAEGQKWGEALAAKILSKLEAQGYKP